MSLDNLDVFEYELIDIDLKKKSKIKVDCDQLDDITLYFGVYNYGNPVNLSELTYDFRALKSDGKFIIQDTGLTIVNGNVLKIECWKDLTRLAGKSIFELTFYKNGKQKSSYDIDLNINKSVIDDGTGESKNVITSLEILNATIPVGREVTKKLQETINTGNETDTKLKSTINNANDTNATLNNSINEGKRTKTNIDESVRVANVTKSNLDSSNATANDTKSKLDTSIFDGVATKKDVDSSNAKATNTKEELAILTDKTKGMIDKIESSQNKSFTIGINDWIDNTGNTEVALYKYNLNHGMKSLDISVDVVDVATNMDAFATCKRVDVDNIVVYSNEKKSLKLILSAGYYNGSDKTMEQVIVKEVADSRNDFDGGKHNSLNERLKSDLDKVYDRFNNASLLEYEGEYITANNSYDGFTKDLSIKGRTLQNIIKNTPWVLNDSKNTAHMVVDWSLLKPNTQYTYIVCGLSSKIDTNEGYVGGNFTKASGHDISRPVLVNTVSDLSVVKITLYLHLYAKTGQTFTIEDLKDTKVMLLEGDWTNKPIPSFFEGIQSVGETEENKIEILSCGENLFDISKATILNGATVVDNTITSPIDQVAYKSYMDYIIKNNNYKSIVLSGKINLGYCELETLDVDNKRISTGRITNSLDQISLPITSQVRFIRVLVNRGNSINSQIVCKNIQLKEATGSTIYEPYQEDKTQILLKEPLRGLPNGVCDEIVEKQVIRRIGKYVINADKEVELVTSTDVDYIRFNLKLNDIKSGVEPTNVLINDKLPTHNSHINGTSDIVTDWNKTIVLFIKKSILSTATREGFMQWLQTNPMTIYYELETPVIEELPAPIKLRTFDKTTHMFLNHLIQPHISAKVPSDVNSVIKTLKAVNDRLSMIVKQNNLNTIALNVDQEARLTALELGVIGR